MNCPLKRLKAKEIEIKSKVQNSIFTEIEKIDNKTIYHTRIFNDFFTFGVSQKEKGKFFIVLRGLFNIYKKSMFHLFSIKESSDKFLGIFYGFRRLKKPIFLKYKKDSTNVIETIPIYKAYYIEFRFKKGSVFCYIKALHALTKKEKFNKKYAQNLLERIINLENELYKFYNKRLLTGGIIIKWMKKNQK